jgi:Outer membrane efflux protein
MGTGPRAVAVCAVVCLHAGAAAAQSTVMTLAEVLARAREEAPQIVSARLALEETRGRLAGASLRFQSNPPDRRGTRQSQRTALHANERIKLLNATYELASGVYLAADRRFKAGDIAVLDVNITRASLARVRATREGAEASKSIALGAVRQLSLVWEAPEAGRGGPQIGALVPSSEVNRRGSCCVWLTRPRHP